MANKLNGKVAIITGAGGGMGKSMAKLFAKEGAKVFICDIKGDAVNATREEILAEGGVAEATKVDMGDAADVAAMVKKAADTFGTIDILINNAGIHDGSFGARELPIEVWDKVMDVDIKGPFIATKEVLPYMMDKKAGWIVNICSIAALSPTGGGAAYTASKHALLGLTRHTSYCYGQAGIRTNAICPGAIDTGLFDKSWLQNPPAGMEPLINRILSTPAGRAADPEEVANLALFLCTEDSSFIHGQAIACDGGWTLV